MKSSLFRAFVLSAVVVSATPAISADAPPMSPQAKATEALVKKAAAEIQKKGSAAFSEFSVKGSEWFHDDTYLFAYNLDVVLLFNAALPQNVGRSPANRSRAPGSPQNFSEAFVETAKTKGAGWVSYKIAKPGQKELSQKWSYVKRVTLDGKPALIGSGFYPN